MDSIGEFLRQHARRLELEPARLLQTHMTQLLRHIMAMHEVPALPGMSAPPPTLHEVRRAEHLVQATRQLLRQLALQLHDRAGPTDTAHPGPPRQQRLLLGEVHACLSRMQESEVLAEAAATDLTQRFAVNRLALICARELAPAAAAAGDEALRDLHRRVLQVAFNVEQLRRQAQLPSDLPPRPPLHLCGHAERLEALEGLSGALPQLLHSAGHNAMVWEILEGCPTFDRCRALCDALQRIDLADAAHHLDAKLIESMVTALGELQDLITFARATL